MLSSVLCINFKVRSRIFVVVLTVKLLWLVAWRKHDDIIIVTELAPSAPQELLAYVIDAVSIRMSWNQPEYNHDSVTGFQIYFLPASEIGIRPYRVNNSTQLKFLSKHSTVTLNLWWYFQH